MGSLQPPCDRARQGEGISPLEQGDPLLQPSPATHPGTILIPTGTLSTV